MGRIQSDPADITKRERYFWRERQRVLRSDGTPKKVQRLIEKILARRATKTEINQARVDHGEFRLQSTLENLQASQESKKRPYYSNRLVGINRPWELSTHSSLNIMQYLEKFITSNHSFLYRKNPGYEAPSSSRSSRS